MATFATATVDVYTTPFHINNRPDSASLLASSATAHSSFTINSLPRTKTAVFKLSKDYCTNADSASYMKVKYSGDANTYFYAIVDRQPLSMDSYEFTVVLDGWLTCKNAGITKIEGITERVHVAKSSDTLGKYIEEDPYLGCTEPLQIDETYLFTGSDYDGTDGVTVVAATFDVNAMGDATYDKALEFMKTGSTDKVSVPDIPSLRDSDQGTLNKTQKVSIPYATSTVSYKEITSPAIDYFYGGDPANNLVTKGLSVAHSLGASDGIVAQYTIPKGFADFGNPIRVVNGRFADSNNNYLIKGKHDNVDSGLEFVYSNTVQNKRLFAGDLNKYGITALATGQNAEFKAEDLMFDSQGSSLTKPSVELYVDPRENGFPTFKYKYINRSLNMFRGAVKGMEWQNVPLVNKEKAGYKYDQFKFMNDGQLLSDQYRTENYKNVVNTLSGIGQNAMGLMSERMQQQASAGIGQSAIQGYANILNQRLDMSYAANARQVEANSIVVADKLVAPEMRFNFNPSIRDVVGNGACSYRMRPTATDLARLDKILNMYGYRVTKTLELSDFSNRSRYNYIKASGVHITCNLPSYVVETAEADLMSGLRIWHVAYDGNYATAND